jgi:hypothetical protein
MAPRVSTWIRGRSSSCGTTRSRPRSRRFRGRPRRGGGSRGTSSCRDAARAGGVRPKGLPAHRSLPDFVGDGFRAATMAERLHGQARSSSNSMSSVAEFASIYADPIAEQRSSNAVLRASNSVRRRSTSELRSVSSPSSALTASSASGPTGPGGPGGPAGPLGPRSPCSPFSA